MIKIYGAGLAGLLCANMLRRFNPEIHEAKPSLPNNHSALLRFRTDKVGTACAIPFSPKTALRALEGLALDTCNAFVYFKKLAAVKKEV